MARSNESLCSFSVASTNFFSPPMLSATSGDPWANQARKNSFFNVTHSLHFGGHHQVLGLSTRETLNMAQILSPTSPRMQEKFIQRWDLKVSFTETSGWT